MNPSAVIAKPTAPSVRRLRLSRQARLAALLLLPTFIVLLLVAFYPLARTFSASLTDEVFARPDLTVNYVGLKNYQKLFSFQLIELPANKRAVEVLAAGYHVLSRFQVGDKTYLLGAMDPEFVTAAVDTLMFTALSVSMELLLGLGLAWIVNMRFPGRGLLRSLMLLPWVIPTVVSAQLWKWMLFDNRAGVMNDLLLRSGAIQQSVAWLAEPRLQMFSVVMIDIWKSTPYVALLLLAGLQAISSDLYEAATVDGATPWQQFTGITLPLLKPVILLALVFRTLDALRVFDLFSVLLGHAMPSLATYNQERLVGTSAYGYASAIGVVIFVVTFVFTFIYMSAFRVNEAT